MHIILAIKIFIFSQTFIFYSNKSYQYFLEKIYYSINQAIFIMYINNS